MGARQRTPAGAVARGLVAGAFGTVAMDAVLYARHRREGGTNNPLRWEFGGERDWEKVSAPAQVGRRLLEGFTQRPLAARWAVVTQNVMHWGYGLAWGGAFGVVAGSVPSRRRPLLGPPFGAAVWLSSYVTLPVAGLYRPIWEYDIETLWKDLSAHLTYGGTTGVAFTLLS